MPPTNQQKEIIETSNMTDLHSNVYYSSQHEKSLIDISISEILLKYQDDSQLLNHILVAKAQEDKRRTAEELRQAEEARLQTKYIEFELTQGSSNTPSIFTSSFVDQHDQFSEHSPLPMTTSEFHYNLTQQETASIASSPSIDFISSSSNFDLYHNDTILFSCPPPTTTIATTEDFPLFPSTNTIETIKVNHNKGKKKTTPSPKNMHRTLSYESVMTLSDLNMNRQPISPPQPPQPPLDHDKVMEALRAKLRKSALPYQTSRPKKHSPPPISPPPPNTQPTTGILLLNLNSRRRKTSVTKRNSSLSSK